jgi:DNA-binding MarR family transcriptional regulator
MSLNKAVELVTELAGFDERYPDGSVEDFCRYYLLHKSGQNKLPNTHVGLAPAAIDFSLMRLIGRISKLHTIYALKATEGTGINSSEEFSLLNSIVSLNEPRKTEAIYTALFELSTGIDMLNRLKKVGFIEEYNDKDDRRSKRVKVTTKGMVALSTCRVRMLKLAEMEFFDLSNDEKKICFQLLSSVDAKFSSLWQSHKGKEFEEVYNQITAGQ